MPTHQGRLAGKTFVCHSSTAGVESTSLESESLLQQAHLNAKLFLRKNAIVRA